MGDEKTVKVLVNKENKVFLVELMKQPVVEANVLKMFQLVFEANPLNKKKKALKSEIRSDFKAFFIYCLQLAQPYYQTFPQKALYMTPQVHD